MNQFENKIITSITDRALFNPHSFMGDDAYVFSYQKKYADLFTSKDNILDIGCGGGVFLKILKQRNIQARGIDISPDAIHAAKKRGVEVIESNPLSYLQNREDEFTGVFCSHFIEHLLPDSLIQLFQLIGRVMKKDGVLIIITPDYTDVEVSSELFWLDVTHVRPYPRMLLEALLRSCGFSVMKSGNDPDTKKRMPRKNFILLLNYVMMKIRYGRRYGTGDTVIIARK